MIKVTGMFDRTFEKEKKKLKCSRIHFFFGGGGGGGGRGHPQIKMYQSKEIIRNVSFISCKLVADYFVNYVS